MARISERDLNASAIRSVDIGARHQSVMTEGAQAPKV
jgi:hypothetical protein